jgi:uncharacterized protein (DUF1778 family)
MAKVAGAQIALKTSPEIKSLIREAANYRGQDMTGFIIGAAVQAARRVLGREGSLKRSGLHILQSLSMKNPRKNGQIHSALRSKF